ncbi:MAG: hypothetical protein ACK50D_10960 [Burkholderiales bacterium]|jgi:hypothetical protein|nr:hypothetical protein [Nitrosomonadaceae bacterium]
MKLTRVQADSIGDAMLAEAQARTPRRSVRALLRPGEYQLCLTAAIVAAVITLGLCAWWFFGVHALTVSDFLRGGFLGAYMLLVYPLCAGGVVFFAFAAWFALGRKKQAMLPLGE